METGCSGRSAAGGLLDRDQAERGKQVRHRVHGQRDRRGEHADEEAGQRGAGDARERGAGLDLAVGFRQMPGLDELRNVGQRPHVERHGQDADSDGHGVEQAHGQHAGHRRERHQADEDRAAEGADDQHRAAAPAVEPHSGEDGQDDHRQEAECEQHTDLEGTRAQREDRYQRHRELGDLGADQRDALTRPQLDEVGVGEDAVTPFGGCGGRCGHGGGLVGSHRQLSFLVR